MRLHSLARETILLWETIPPSKAIPTPPVTSSPICAQVQSRAAAPTLHAAHLSPYPSQSPLASPLQTPHPSPSTQNTARSHSPTSIGSAPQ